MWSGGCKPGWASPRSRSASWRPSASAACASRASRSAPTSWTRSCTRPPPASPATTSTGGCSPRSTTSPSRGASRATRTSPSSRAATASTTERSATRTAAPDSSPSGSARPSSSSSTATATRAIGSRAPQGHLAFDEELPIAGVILNKTKDAAHEKHIRDSIEGAGIGAPIFGALRGTTPGSGCSGTGAAIMDRTRRSPPPRPRRLPR